MVSEVLRYAPYVLFRPDAFQYENGFSALTVTKTDLIPKPAGSRIPVSFRHVATRCPSPSSAPEYLTLLNDTAGPITLNGTAAEEEQTVVVVEQTEPETDANVPMNNQFIKGLVWLILKYIPTSQYYQDGDGIWHKRFRWNALRPREIYNSSPNFHVSVKLRKYYEGKWLTKFVPERGQQLKINYVE